MGDKMTLKKPSEIDLELDRLQADLDRCGAEQKALDAQKQGIREKMAATLVTKLLKEQVFRQREWRPRFWYDGRFCLEAYPQPEAWDWVDELVGTPGDRRAVSIPLPGQATVTFRLTRMEEYIFEFPSRDPGPVIRAVQALGLTVVGLSALEDEVKAQQAVLDQKRAALDQFRQAFGEPED